MKRPEERPGRVDAAAASLPTAAEPQTAITRSNPSIDNGFFAPSNPIAIDRVLQFTCSSWADCLTGSSPPEQSTMAEAGFGEYVTAKMQQ
jgi:hypothetical protein